MYMNINVHLEDQTRMPTGIWVNMQLKGIIVNFLLKEISSSV